MKLGLMTWNIGKDAPLGELVSVVQAIGLSGIEFRAGADQKHGVELERTAAERSGIRRTLEAAGIAAAGIATGCEFHFAEAEKRREQVEKAKRYADLAADLGAPQIRVFSNELPAGHTREEIVGWTAECLREAGEHGARRGVRVNLELHGRFQDPVLCLGAVERSGHKNVGIVYNSLPSDVHDGSIREVFEMVAPRIRHVHIHEFGGEAGFPYPELFELLVRRKYDGWLSCEVGKLNLKSFLSVYKACFEALVKFASQKVAA